MALRIDLGDMSICESRKSLRARMSERLSSMSIREWLTSLNLTNNLETYISGFVKEGFRSLAVEVMDANISDQDLVKIGVSVKTDREVILRDLEPFCRTIPRVEEIASATPAAVTLQDPHIAAQFEAAQAISDRDAFLQQQRFASLHDAVRAGDLETVLAFIEHDPPSIRSVEKYNDTPLHVACDRSLVDIVEILLDAKAAVNMTNLWHSTPLHIATQRGNSAIVRGLVANKADVNVRNEAGRTPLMTANECHHAEIVQILKNAGAKQ